MKGEINSMTSEDIYSRFKPGINPPQDITGSEWWFIFHDNKLLVKKEGNEVNILKNTDLTDLNLNIIRSQYLGSFDGDNCYSAEIGEIIMDSEKMGLRDLRSLLGLLKEDMFSIAGQAFQIVNWDRTHQYCGKCGAQTVPKTNERAKACPECGFLSFPRISPAIIVAIIRDNKILLAHNSQFKNNMHSAIAGFVEPGETFEECVRREVEEEVGIKVKNIKYFGSQPWPFPHSLMIGFTAEYAGGEIKVDGVEIDDAGWFSVHSLPDMLPSKYSIARKLIDWFIKNNNEAL